jgi:hypothetical protein
LRAGKEIPQKGSERRGPSEIRSTAHRLLFSRTVKLTPLLPEGEVAMNPSPSKNPLPATRGNATFDARWDFDVNFSDAALCEFSGWMDDELLGLESLFEAFVTVRSQKRSFGR